MYSAFGIYNQPFPYGCKWDSPHIAQSLQRPGRNMQVFAYLVARHIAFPTDHRTVIPFRSLQGPLYLSNTCPGILYLLGVRRQIIQRHYFTPFLLVRVRKYSSMSFGR